MKKKEAMAVIEGAVAAMRRCSAAAVIDGERIAARQIVAGAYSALAWAYFLLEDEDGRIVDDPIDVIEAVVESALKSMGVIGCKGGE